MVSQPYISVSLSSYFTQVGITDQGSTMKPAFTAGGEIYSSAYLRSTLSWGGLTFNLGAPNVNDEVPMGGAIGWLAPTLWLGGWPLRCYLENIRQKRDPAD